MRRLKILKSVPTECSFRLFKSIPDSEFTDPVLNLMDEFHDAWSYASEESQAAGPLSEVDFTRLAADAERRDALILFFNGEPAAVQGFAVHEGGTANDEGVYVREKFRGSSFPGMLREVLYEHFKAGGVSVFYVGKEGLGSSKNILDTPQAQGLAKKDVMDQSDALIEVECEGQRICSYGLVLDKFDFKHVNRSGFLKELV